MTAAERTNALIDQCAMWCSARRIEPVPNIWSLGSLDRAALLMAVHQTKLKFADLNTNQRKLIAGLPKT